MMTITAPVGSLSKCKDAYCSCFITQTSRNSCAPSARKFQWRCQRS